MLEPEIVRHPLFHKQAFKILKCGYYIISGSEDQISNRHVLAWVTRVSINPPVVSIALDKSGNDLELIDISENITIHIFSDDQIQEENPILREKYHRHHTENIPSTNHIKLKGHCALFDTNKIGFVETDDKKYYIANVKFSRIDHTKTPVYF